MVLGSIRVGAEVRVRCKTIIFPFPSLYFQVRVNRASYCLLHSRCSINTHLKSYQGQRAFTPHDQWPGPDPGLMKPEAYLVCLARLGRQHKFLFWKFSKSSFAFLPPILCEPKFLVKGDWQEFEEILIKRSCSGSAYRYFKHQRWCLMKYKWKTQYFHLCGWKIFGNIMHTLYLTSPELL